MALQLAEVSRFLRSRVAKAKGVGNIPRFLVREGYVDRGNKRVGGGLSSFSPLNRFFPVHKLEAFSYNDMKDYITKKLKGSKINIEERAIKLITEKSEGHPYVLVSMCFIMFETLQENEDVITEDIIKRALPKIYLELEKDFFSPMFHPLTPKAKEVLFKICNNINSLNFSFREAIKWTKLNGNYVSPYIQELLRKGIINKPERGKYQIFHKLFIEYVKKLSIYSQKR